MNRLHLITILLLMFLNCSNSNPGHKSQTGGVETGSAASDDDLSQQESLLATQLDLLFNQYYRSGMFNGTVLVAKSGKVIYKKALGFADRKNKLLLSDSSMFQLASVSKVITSTAVLMLHERELLNIDKQVKEYLPDFPYEGVTIKHLLNHRSGLPNYLYVLNRELYIPDYKMSNEDMYNYLVAKNPKRYARPNLRFDYSNTNYALLGYLVEKVSGKPFNQFLKDELFTPLGMKHTATIRDIDFNDPLVTKPYDTRWRPVRSDASDFVVGDKSIYSTSYDLYLFSEALFNNRVIKPETQQMAYTPCSYEARAKNYGLGWRMRDCDKPEKKEVYHNGWWHGYRTAFHRRLKDTLTVVILSNQLNHSAYHAMKVMQIIDVSRVGEDEAAED